MWLKPNRATGSKKWLAREIAAVTMAHPSTLPRAKSDTKMKTATAMKKRSRGIFQPLFTMIRLPETVAALQQVSGR
jgi:hypothetical protein